MELIKKQFVDEIVKRQIAQEKFDKPKKVEAPKKAKEIGPKTAMLLGSLADSASTYAFLKNGQREANPALQFFNQRPWTVMPTAAAGAAGYNALHGLISKKSPRIANTLAGLLGGYHAALAGKNMEPTKGTGSYEAVVNKLQLPLKRR